MLWILLIFAIGLTASGQEPHSSSNSQGSSQLAHGSLDSKTGSTSGTHTAGSVPPTSSSPDQSLDATSYCEALSKRTTQRAALAQACEFALSLGQHLPNVICSQETTRYEDIGHGFRLQDVITAQVSFEEGQEHYRDMASNGKPIESATPSLTAGWSTGEFASALVGIFSPLSLAEFSFKKRDILHATPALVFEYHIAKLDNELWHVQVGDAKTYPGYSGRLWVNATTFRPMRLERGHIEVNPDFPIRQIKSVIDYVDVQLGDGTSFDLPVQSETVVCHAADLKPCWRSVLKFRNWHKFATRTRILSDSEPQPDQAPKAGSTPGPPRQDSSK